MHARRESRIDWPVGEGPPRSRLYHLPPIGLGTPKTESLTSYLVRLARAHCVSPRLLIKTEFVSVSPELAGIVLGGFFSRYAGTMNGLGKYAQIFASATAALTTSDAIRQLTLLPLRELLPHNGAGLLAKHRQWCPLCLQEMGREPFWPLAWSLILYRVCHEHSIAMQHLCDQCHRPQPFIPKYPVLSHCAWCGYSLAVHGFRRETPEIDVWLANAISDFVGKLIALESALTREHFLERLTEVMEWQIDKSKVACLREIGLPRWLLKNWFDKGERPSFVQMMRLCYGLGIRPAELFTTEPIVLSPRPVSGLMVRKSAPRLTVGDKAVIEQTLNRVLAPTHTQKPAYVVAKDIGLTRGGLRYLFPKQYDALRDAAISSRIEAASSRQQRLVRTVQMLVHEMKARGEYPSRRKINEKLREHGASLSVPILLATYRKERG